MATNSLSGAPAGDRLIAAAGSAAVVALAAWVLVAGLAVRMPVAGERALATIDLAPPPPPPPPPPPASRPHVRQPLRRPARQAPSPPNRHATPTAVVAPPPIVVPPPPPPPVAVAPVAGRGRAATAGAADRAGPGYGAGGAGDGPGGGGDGDGGDTPPEQVRGRLRIADLPPDLRAAGVGGAVGVRYRVGTDGRVTGCVAARSSGTVALDRLTCALVEQRFRFRPSRDGDGRPVPSIVEETHTWEFVREDDRD